MKIKILALCLIFIIMSGFNISIAQMNQMDIEYEFVFILKGDTIKYTLSDSSTKQYADGTLILLRNPILNSENTAFFYIVTKERIYEVDIYLYKNRFKYQVSIHKGKRKFYYEIKMNEFGIGSVGLCYKKNSSYYKTIIQRYLSEK